MDLGTFILAVIVIVGIAIYARWYFDESDTEEDIELHEMDLGIDDRMRELLDIDDDPHGEDVEIVSYRATLVNRGKESL